MLSVAWNASHGEYLVHWRRGGSCKRFGGLCFVCGLYGAAGTILIAYGGLAITANLTDGTLQAWTGASVGLGLIGAGSFALIVSLLAFIANAVADQQVR